MGSEMCIRDKSKSSIAGRLFLMKMRQRIKVIMPMKMTPPTTPPDIAPTLGPREPVDSVVAPESLALTQVLEAHWLHVSDI